MERTIGERQRWAWLLSALSVVAVTEISVYNWPWVALGALLVSGYYLFLERFAPSMGIADTMASLGMPGKAMILLTIIWNIAAMGWAASLADTAFPMIDGFPVLGWVLLAAAAWGSWKGAAACARCCSVLSLFLLFLYGIIAAFAMPDVHWKNLNPSGNWQELLWVGGLLLAGTGVWYMPCRQKAKKAGWAMAMVLTIGALVLSVVTAGVLSPALVAVSRVPLYEVAQSVSLFGVIERIESLLSAAMTMGVFALLSTMAATCQCLGNKLRQWNYYGVICCAAAFGTMYLRKYFTVEFRTFGAGIIWLVLPIAVIVVNRKRSPNP